MSIDASFNDAPGYESLDFRDGVVEFLRSQILGPIGGKEEELLDSPRVRYLVGILFPQQSTRSEVNPDEEDDSVESEDEEGAKDSPVVTPDDWLPSSLGVSFFTKATKINCDVWGARYTETIISKQRSWRREAFAEKTAPLRELIDSNRSSIVVFGGRAAITSVWRPYRSGYLVTIALTNTSIIERPETGELSVEDRKRQDTECLHQVGFRCTPVESPILEYPTIDETFRDNEENELNLIYSHAKVYGIGHGCSVSWDSRGLAQASTIETEHLPTHDVEPVAFDMDGFDDVLSLKNLAAFEKALLLERLNAFIDSYDRWRDDLVAKMVPARFSDAKLRILSRISAASCRMREGVKFLSDDMQALKAFRLANRAMLMQMFRNMVIGGRVFNRESTPVSAIRVEEFNASWRPFQLAFQLLTLKSTAEISDPDREIVDLIWFPTGGGKTEAYLGLAAFILFLQRLRLGKRGAGTTVMTRYTLSLLTAQQFQRAASLICAMESLRQHEPALSNYPFTIGLWIGAKNAPNRFSEARNAFERMLDEEEPSNPFQLQQCPWCGTAIVPRHRTNSEADYGVRSSATGFEFFCPTTSCEFHPKLPINVVDEALYSHPPSLLLATVDKFAQLPWSDRAGVFFGTAEFAPPSLIIQDELHLLSGPLGTSVGLYETAIELLIGLNGGKSKIVASSATIRRAREQVVGLFGRTQTAVFPPIGLDSRDSFYARASRKPGRRYIGLLPQSHSTQTAVVNAATAILQSPIATALKGVYLDAMWTLIVYHNSLRELGRTINLARDDVPRRLEAWYKNTARVITDDEVMELRSNLDGAALPARLQQLKVTQSEGGALSLVGCTNMFSVGVDVSRLGLMLVNGQPKSTSEYIQATSRVGRGEAAGIVVVLYGATRPRDRSHYEQFRAFHSSLYMRVEPMSVTPFSPPSRRRALHAVLVALMRHWGSLLKDNDAGKFRLELPELATVRAAIASRVATIDPEEMHATMLEFDQLVEEWDALARKTAELGKPLYYRSAGRAHTNLLKGYDKRSLGVWETPTSMRSVDAECELAVVGAPL